MFDHGCDAFSMGLITVTLSKLFRCGNNIITLMAVASSCASFYFTTIEEYYTGGMFLQIGNAVTDGSGPTIMFICYMGYMDPSHYQ